MRLTGRTIVLIPSGFSPENSSPVIRRSRYSWTKGPGLVWACCPSDELEAEASRTIGTSLDQKRIAI
jgi:hypothetical protein